MSTLKKGNIKTPFHRIDVLVPLSKLLQEIGYNCISLRQSTVNLKILNYMWIQIYSNPSVDCRFLLIHMNEFVYIKLIYLFLLIIFFNKGIFFICLICFTIWCVSPKCFR